jgi:protein-disulfide isomerase
MKKEKARHASENESANITNESLEQTKGNKEYFEIRIPRLSFQNNGINTYLVFILVVFAFLLGMLTNKLVYLQKQTKGQTQANAAGANNVPTIDPNATPTPLPKVNIDMGKLPILGDNKAKVTMIEFGDFQCPFCKQYFDQTAQQVMDTYVKPGKVKFAYRYYPLVTIHPNAQKSAEAAACANDQGKFWDMHDLLFKNQDTWANQAAADAENSFVDYAGQVGIDTNQFRNCLDTNQDKALVDADVAAGNRIGVSGTPTFVINGNIIVGAVPFSDLQKVIDQELKK